MSTARSISLRVIPAGLIDLRPVFYVLGVLLVLLAAGMLMPAAIDLAMDNPDWRVFFTASMVTGFIGFSAILTQRTRAGGERLTLRQAFVMTVLVWVLLPAFGALPFVFSDRALSYTDAFFEAMSGLTTTGATVISGLDGLPPGILLWRSLLQWLGGIGVVVMAVSVLPMLQVGGMQLFRTESFDTAEKILPSAQQLAGAITLVYVLLTLAAVIALWAAGMTPFDAVAHAMTSIATGGYSTHDASISFYDSWQIEAIITVFMIVSCFPFIYLVQVLRGRPKALWYDSQTRAFVGTVVALVSFTCLWLVTFKAFDPATALRYASFNVVSIMTGTGYASTDYAAWGAFANTLFFFIMFIGGCAGSTSCGIKIFRFQVLATVMQQTFQNIRRPHGIFLPRYNGRPLHHSVISSVMSFFFLFIIVFLALSVALAMTGLEPLTALSGAGTALSNVGPGVGPVIGPSGNFESLPATAKWLLSFGMLAGRLELFTVFVLLTPRFWRG